MEYPYEIKGLCPICEFQTVFLAGGPWHRGQLMCKSCVNGSVPRERALALVLNRVMSEWRKLRIHESSPAQRGISEKLSRESFAYTATHFYPDKPLGSFHNGYQNEDLLRQTFSDEFFDLVITLDVTEHVPDPEKMFKEIYRTLKPGGAYISTFPIHKRQIQPIDKRVSFDVEGSLVYEKEPPEYHGNPIDSKGSLVWTDFGYDIHIEIAQYTGFDVEVTRFADALHGIIGEYTEVIVCWKREII